MQNPIPADHVTMALRAVLDHIDNHHVAVPWEIGTSTAPHHDGRIAVNVYSADLPSWIASIEVDDDRAEVRDGVVFATIDGRLPETGIRIRIKAISERMAVAS